MKLFTRYNRINLLFTILIFLLASTAFYFLLRFILINMVDDNLKIEQHEIETYVAKYHTLPEIMAVKNQQISFTAGDSCRQQPRFSITRVYDAAERENDSWRQLVFCKKINTQWYQVTISKSMEETDSITRAVILITLITIVLILASSQVINRIVLKKLWRPFYESLHAMQQFRIGQEHSIQLPITETEEFERMNQTLQQATGKANQDYLLLKEFTENASHELQTPLSIIRSKLDMLIQDEQLAASHSTTLESAYTAVQRLSRLNQSLLLLAKIDNLQFPDTANIDLRQKITEKLEQFQELWQGKQMNLTQVLQPASIAMNNELADILLNNLISNAIRYTPNGGKLHILFNSQVLEVSNTAVGPALSAERVFTRFYTASPSNEGHGLGLSIIKRIVEVAGYMVDYHLREGMHVFTLRFRTGTM